MSVHQVIFDSEGPIAVFESVDRALEALDNLPSWSSLRMYAVPLNPGMACREGNIVAVLGREPCVSGAAPSAAVALSLVGNKIR